MDRNKVIAQCVLCGVLEKRGKGWTKNVEPLSFPQKYAGKICPDCRPKT